MEGIKGIKPVIKKVAFNLPGKISVYLEDGRIIIAPLNLFPGIKKIPSQKRMKYTIYNDQIIVFHYGDENYHIQDFLGVEADYIYAG